MRLIKQNFERDGSGFVTLFPEDPEDMVKSTGPSFSASSSSTDDIEVVCL